MSKLDSETEMRLYKHFVLVCRKCGYKFLPWHCLSKCTKETGWENSYCCPNPDCREWGKKEDYDNLKELEKMAESE